MTETSDIASQKSEKNTTLSQSSREPLFGAILFAIFLFFVVIVVIGVSWGIYRGYRLSQERAVLPSISTIALDEVTEEVVEEPKEEVVAEQKVLDEADSQEALLKKAQATNTKVLNGGAAKGSASVIAGLLTQAGFTKVEIGNTIKDYAGIVIYFAPEAEKEAEAMKTILVKNYPKITTQPAIVSNTETTQAPLSVIFGK